jgi:hypothetical protein
MRKDGGTSSRQAPPHVPPRWEKGQRKGATCQGTAKAVLDSGAMSVKPKKKGA